MIEMNDKAIYDVTMSTDTHFITCYALNLAKTTKNKEKSVGG
jgi:hypothetical protein